MLEYGTKVPWELLHVLRSCVHALLIICNLGDACFPVPCSVSMVHCRVLGWGASCLGCSRCVLSCGMPTAVCCSPNEYHSLGPLAPKPYTHKLIGMLGAIICAAAIIFVGYMSVGVAGGRGAYIILSGMCFQRTVVQLEWFRCCQLTCAQLEWQVVSANSLRRHGLACWYSSWTGLGVWCSVLS